MLESNSLNLEGIEELAARHAAVREEIRSWGAERGLSFEIALRWVASYANAQGMYDRQEVRNGIVGSEGANRNARREGSHERP